MMRNGQNKRMRGRNRNNNNHSHNQNRGHHHNPLTRVYESNGPDVKIRGTAHHIAEKYLQLARDATSAGDHVTAEAHHQHAEHYFRLIAAAQEQFRQQNPHYQPQPVQADANAEGGQDEGDENAGQQQQPQQQNFTQQPNFQQQPQQQPNFQQPQQQQPQQQPYGGPQQQYGRPQQQNYQQPQQQQPQQQPANFGSNDAGGLPSFITGGQQQAPQAPQYGGSNGHDGNQGDRNNFRRRRRHRGPHHQGGQDMRGDNAPESPGNE